MGGGEGGGEGGESGTLLHDTYTCYTLPKTSNTGIHNKIVVQVLLYK